MEKPRRQLKREEDLIKGNTLGLDMKKLDFQIMGFTFVKRRRERHLRPEEYEESLKRSREWFMKHPSAIFVAPGEGMGWDVVCVSLHRSYSDFARFKRNHDMELSHMITESESFVADMNPRVVVKPLSLKYLANAK